MDFFVRKIGGISFFVVTLLFFAIPHVHAVSVQFNPEYTWVRVPQSVAVPVGFSLDQGEYINTAQGSIAYSGDALSLVSVTQENSSIPLWFDEPMVDPSCAGECSITFGGIIPGGYGQTTKQGGLFTLHFVSQQPGDAFVRMSDAQFLLHDGEGTPAHTSMPDPITIVVADLEAPEGSVREYIDTFAPEPFSIELSRDDSIENGKWFIVFLAHDKQSGIASYEVLESYRQLAIEQLKEGKYKWARATSPFVLRNQSLKKYVYVKAIDQVGNVRVAEFEPQNDPAWFVRIPKNALVVIAVLFFVLVVRVLLWKRV